MNTNTDLANRALSHIGIMPITDINDVEKKEARVCKNCIENVIDEVLREHRWNCAIKRVTLSYVGKPNHGFDRSYQLPGDFLRLLELNGEQFSGSEEYLEIEEQERLLTNADKAEIRYIRRIGVSEFDPLLAKAVSAALAAEICIPLNMNLQMQAQLEGLKARAISKAQRVDAIESGSREGTPIQRAIANSPLVQARYRGSRSCNPLRYHLP